MESINFNLNSLSFDLGRKQVSVKHSKDFLNKEQKGYFTYFIDWKEIEGLIHLNDTNFYLDDELIKELKLEKANEDTTIQLKVPGQNEFTSVVFYKLRIFNSQTSVYDEIVCLPFKNLHKIMNINILIPNK